MVPLEKELVLKEQQTMKTEPSQQEYRMSEENYLLLLQEHGLLKRILYCLMVGYLPCASNIVIFQYFKEYCVDALDIALCDMNSAC